MTVDPDTPLRADARRNRDQIVAGAKAVFQEHGPEVPMEEIARQAGVGVGTLYRRFPDRESLISAVARDSFLRVRDEVRAVAAQEPGAWHTVGQLLARSREMRVVVRLGASQRARTAVENDTAVHRTQKEINDILEQVIAASQREGTLRPDVGAGDFMVLMSLLVKHTPTAEEDTADMVLDRATALVLDGLRAPGTPLPGRPVTPRDVLQAPRIRP
jgi:AcrR family transcriptional regulator